MLIGNPSGRRVLHLVMMPAAGLGGATSVSLSVEDPIGTDPLVRRCDLLFSEEPVPGDGGRLPLTSVTLASVVAHPVSAANPDGLADERAAPQVQRLVRTSGTTGRPKAMASTAALNQAMPDVERAPAPIRRYGWTY